MSAKEIGKQLVEAWRLEGEQALSVEGQLGERLARLLDEALEKKCLQESLAHALHLQIDSQAVMFLNREGEKMAGLHFGDPKNPGQKDAECALIALPCSGDVLGLNHWLQQGNRSEQMTSHIREHVALLTGAQPNQVLDLAVLPVMLPPTILAKLTAESRRELLLEMATGLNGSLVSSLSEHGLPMEDPQTVDRPTLTEGILVAVATVIERPGVSPATAEAENRVIDLALGLMDEDFLEQSEDLWEERMEAMELPPLVQVSQPLSLNEALVQSLHTALMTVRFKMIPDEVLEGMAQDDEPIALPEIHHLTVVPTEERTIRMDIHSNYGQAVVEMNIDWAMVEGEEAFREVLVSAMDLEDTSWDGPTDSQEADSGEPEDVVGDHPAWARAHPTPRGMN